MTPSENHQQFIIGGTIKAATSSLFNYLSAHPQVCGSKVKETYFFSQHYTGDFDRDLKKYMEYFSPEPVHRVLLEASPNYLAYPEDVAPRMKQLLPGLKIMFVLRNPVGRLYSHFNFAKSKMEIPQDLGFEEFVELCERYNDGQLTPAEAGIADRNLRALEIGNYGSYLPNFLDRFDSNDLHVIFYDDLAKRPLEIMVEICKFVNIDSSFFEDYSMQKANVTYSSRMKVLHFSALTLNRTLEPFFRKFPKFKRSLVNFYRLINQKNQGFSPMQEETREKLKRYYEPSNARLKSLLAGQSLPVWIDPD